MSNNIFETLKERKTKLKHLIEKAALYGWLNVERKSEMLKKLDSDTLTIGVIGQMKCGKSTFLNSFVFEDTILPAATTPMTAALSVITYGEKERIVAEFYTQDEWAEQKLQAARSIDDAQGNAAEESKIKAAKELVAKSDKLGSELNSLLGKTKEDEFRNLIQYVGADGKYISITKAVTIYYPKDYLKGVEIVDTPGFNDPIVSREERTKDFLKRADVVLMMLYAGRPFDATDRDIIFKNVRQCGIGKVLIGINKYDIPYCSATNPEDEDQIRDYVIAEIKKASRDCKDNILIEILSETTPVPLSAEMALLSQIPMSKITENEALTFAWNRHCQNFGIASQQEMHKWSHIDQLIGSVKDMVIREKDAILFSKPINAIMAAGNEAISETDKQIQLKESEIELLQLPDDEIEEKEYNLNKAHRKLKSKIDSLGEDIQEEMTSIIRKGNNTLEDDVDAACNKMRSIVDTEWKKLTNYDSKIRPRLDAEYNRLVTRTLKRSVENIASSAKRSIDKCISEFFSDTEDTFMKYLPDLDARGFMKSVQKKVKLDVTEKNLFSAPEKEDEDYGILELIGDMINGASWGMIGMAGRLLNYDSQKRDVLDKINAISADFNPGPYLETIMSTKDNIISTVKSAFLNDLIEPLLEQIEEVKSHKDEKTGRLKSAEESLVSLSQRRKDLAQQMEDIERLKTELY